MTRRRAVSLAALTAAVLAIAGCAGDERPWEAHDADAIQAPDRIPPPQPATPTTPPAPAQPAMPPAESSTPPNDASGPARAGDASEADPARDQAPRRAAPRERADGDPTEPATEAERVAADEAAMMRLRTMVSIIEGCNSGRESYELCNTHAELGSPKQLGLEIGRRREQVQITASPRGFRITTRSPSGARFTMARGPAGDRFSCVPGPQPGACPAAGTWSW